jgi:hypothetical protein
VVGSVIITNGGYEPDFSQFPGPVEGYSHNHPQWVYTGGVFEEMFPELRNENRYPSNGDWAVLQAIVDHYGPITGVYDPSLYLTDSWGVTREFKLSERTYIQALGHQQMQRGDGLVGREIESGNCP